MLPEQRRCFWIFLKISVQEEQAVYPRAMYASLDSLKCCVRRWLLRDFREEKRLKQVRHRKSLDKFLLPFEVVEELSLSEEELAERFSLILDNFVG